MKPLDPIAEKFILHWGEMGNAWGVNRTVAQIHALLYLSPKPLTAEEIAAALTVARSNVSNSLKELQGWGVIKVVHELGDRRDHFQCMSDVWEMFRVILDERKKREADPTLALLQQCNAQAEKSTDAFLKQRLGAMLSFFELMTDCYDKSRSLPIPTLLKLVQVGSRVKKLIKR